MDLKTAQHLSQLTSTFYQEVSPSFSATRESAWPGWMRMMDELDLRGRTDLDVLDIACGNLRFERFLAQQGLDVQAWAVDSCDDLVARGQRPLYAMHPNTSVAYQHLDVMDTLYAGDDLVDSLVAPACDLAVCFGFMHHVPLPEHRLQVLEALLAHVRLGGYVAVSYWQFMRDARLREKARPVEGGREGDYLLGWQDRTDVARYCHSFTEHEIDELVRVLPSAVSEVARFSADGRLGNLNRYVVLQRR